MAQLFKDNWYWIQLIVFVIGFGSMWGSMTTQLQAHEKTIEKLECKIDQLYSAFWEYKYTEARK
jgi:hypothetical protein